MYAILAEKYRPSVIEDYLFDPEGTLVDSVDKWLSEQSIPNLLFFSESPGTGKTTLSRLLMNALEIHKSDRLFVNASLLNGIGFVREQLEPWIKKKGLSRFKIVELGEADQLTPAAQKALREITEAYSDHVRFIMTANHLNKIHPAIQSRFQVVKMEPLPDEVILERLLDILEKEGISIENDDDLLSHVATFHPDMRKILVSIEASTFQGRLRPVSRDTFQKFSEGFDAWEHYLETAPEIDPTALIGMVDGIDQSNFEDFYDAFYRNSHKFGAMEGFAILLCAKYLHMAYTVANQELCLKAFLYEFKLEQENGNA